MQEQLTIRLNGMRFRGAYGYYPDEQRLNQEWIVDIAVHFHPEKTFSTLRDTFDYEQLYIWVKELMEQPAALMETRAQEIADMLYDQLQHVAQIEVVITKPCPLLGGRWKARRYISAERIPKSKKPVLCINICSGCPSGLAGLWPYRHNNLLLIQKNNRPNNSLQKCMSLKP